MNSLNDISESFTVMFPYSKTTSQMRRKHTYIANFGIAPHFVSVLNHEFSKSAIYSLSFAESLNKTTQECEMDLLIRFCGETDNDVKVRCIVSSFFWTCNSKRLQ